jgi:hypothetical protein
MKRKNKRELEEELAEANANLNVTMWVASILVTVSLVMFITAPIVIFGLR